MSGNIVFTLPPDRVEREARGAEGVALTCAFRLGHILEGWVRGRAMTGRPKQLRAVARLLRSTADEVEAVANLREVRR